MKTKIGFLGSCSTRDIFRSVHNAKYSDEFEICFQQQRVSLISLMQDSVPYTFDSTRRIENGQEKVFCSEWIRDDLSKSLFEELKQGIDYLFIDIYFDVLFGVIIYDNTIITNNIWDAPFTDFYLNIENKEILTMCNNHAKYFELWKENCDKFFEYMNQKFPETKIVLNKIRAATKVIRKDGSSYIAPSYVKRAERMNTSLAELEQYIIDNHDVKVIDCLEYAIADEGHIWGRYCVHYIKDYYRLAYRQIKDLMIDDKFNFKKLNSKINSISKEIELLCIENKKLNQENERLIEKYETFNEEKIDDYFFEFLDSLETIEVGISKVSIPEGYKIQNKGFNGILFFNNKTYMGIYEVPKGSSFNKKVKELDKKYENCKTKTYTINNITLKSITVEDKNNKMSETYFEKNGIKYHIYEKGAEDKKAFNTLFYSINFNYAKYQMLVDKVKKIPQLSCTSFGYSTADGKIRYHNWRSAFIQRTLMDDFNDYCEKIWFTRYLNHRFPNEDFKINFIGTYETHHTLKWPMEGKKVFYSIENLNYLFLDMKNNYDTYALDYVDLSMGYDLVDDKKYLRFPYWAYAHFSPEVNEEEIENTIDNWNSLNYEKSQDVVSISSHDNWNTRKRISDDIEKIVEITYAGKWRNNTDELWVKFNNNKEEYMKQFKFNLCAENLVSDAYVTEKIFDAIKSDCIPLYLGGGDYLEPKVLNQNAILRWFMEDTIDNSDTIELFKNIYSDEKTYNEFKDQDVLLDSSKKYIINMFADLEKHFERLIYD